MEKEATKRYGVWGFWLPIAWIIYFLLLIATQYSENNLFGEILGNIVEHKVIYFMVVLIFPIIALILCGIQLKIKRTKFAIVGLILSIIEIIILVVSIFLSQGALNVGS